MKKENMLESMELIDEKYVNEASPLNAKNISGRRKGKRIRALIAVAVVAAMLASLSLWLFLPLKTASGESSKYSGSEYYQIIKRLEEVRTRGLTYANNFEKIMDSSWFSAKNGAAMRDYGADMVAEAPFLDGAESAMEGTKSSTSSDQYVEVTDNQVSGVIEADLFKRSDKYIFYLREKTLSVYSIDKENSKEVCSYTIELPEDTVYGNNHGLFLSSDCKTVVILANEYKKMKREVSDGKNRDIYPDGYYPVDYSMTCVSLRFLDVSDVQNGIKEIKCVNISGSYKSSRLIGGKLLLMSDYYAESDPDYSDEKTFVPQIDLGEGPVSISADSIIFPDVLDSRRYTVVSMIDIGSANIEDTAAFLSYSQTIYVSNDSVYATRNYYDRTGSSKNEETETLTEIVRMKYADGKLSDAGKVTVNGRVNNQYSLDEYKGILRVFTTTEKSEIQKYYELDGVYESYNTKENASLFCIDVDEMKVKASVEDFAPEGESVRSARFDGELAYVCTSVQLRDPVFCFDLSDLGNITWKSTGTIEGFSTSLVNFGNGFLLGIGVGSSRDTLKIEVYEETENDVSSVCKYELPNTYISSDYKAYLIDRENQLVGLGINSLENYQWNNYQATSYYILLHFDKYNLNELLKEGFVGSTDYMRAVYIDGYLYMFSDVEFNVCRIG